MWPDLLKRLAEYPSAVLSGRDAEGYPFSVRCHPEPDQAAHVLRVRVAPGLPLQAGPASLLCHSHDAQLWNQRSFLLRGRLERTGEDWVFRPGQMITGLGYGGLPAILRFAIGARRQAARYLAARGLPRPAIPWADVAAIKDRARRPRPS